MVKVNHNKVAHTDLIILRWLVSHPLIETYQGLNKPGQQKWSGQVLFTMLEGKNKVVSRLIRPDSLIVIIIFYIAHKNCWN